MLLDIIGFFTRWIKDEGKRKHVNQFLGFAVVGAAMTILTIGLFFVFLDVLNFPLKITYVGITIFTVYISYLLNNSMVFKQDHSLKKMLLYYGVYLSGMCIGLVLLHYYEKMFPYRKSILSSMTIPVTLIWNYILSSLVLKDKKKPSIDTIEG